MNDLKRLFGAFGLLGAAVWLLVFALSYYYFAFDLSLAHGLHVNDRVLLGRDFVNIWEGGQIAFEEGSAPIYDRDEYRNRLMQDAGIGGLYAFSYPPHILAFTIPFGAFSYPFALIAWTLAGAWLFWYAAKPWLRDVDLPSWVALILPASLINIWAGHFGFIISGLALIGWRNAEKNPVKSGLSFALMTIKPHLGILVPPILVAMRCWRTIGWTIGGLICLLALSVILFGAQSWVTWVTSTLPFQNSLLASNDPEMTYIFMMPTVERLISGFTYEFSAILIVKALFSFLALASLYLAWRAQVALFDLALLTFIAVFLVLPYSFIYDMTGVCLAVLIFAVRWQKKLGIVGHIIFASAFLTPVLHAPIAHLGFAYSPLALLGVLLIATYRLIEESPSRSDSRPEDMNGKFDPKQEITDPAVPAILSARHLA